MNETDRTLKAGQVYLVLGILLLTHCTPSREEEASRKDAYDENDIAEPEEPKHEGVVHTVEIKQMKFNPEVIRVHKGDKVVWINKDIVEHDVTELNSNAWASSKMAVGSSWSMIVTKSEAYYCNLHVVMRGKIVADGDDISMVESSMVTICR
jgi:plastocyanin